MLTETTVRHSRSIDAEIHRMQPRPLRLQLVVACIAVAFAGNVAADDYNPYYIGASQTFTYQSNVYSSEVNPISSGISSTNLLAGFDQPFGRQRFYANGRVGYNYYSNEEVKLLNNTSYGLRAGWDWQTVERLSGTVTVAANQSLANYATPGAPTITEKNIQNLGQGGLTAKYGITPRVSLDAGYQYRRLNYSAADYAYQDFTQNVYSLGLRYGQSGVLNFGVGARVAEAEYPRYKSDPAQPGTYFVDKSTANYVDLTASWVPSGLSSLDARLSWTDITHTLNVGSDFSGLTGALGWNYEVSGKLSTRLSLLVAPGPGATFYEFTGVGTTLVENSRLTKIVGLSADYAASGKVSLTGAINLVQNNYGQKSAVGTTYGTDFTTRLALGVTYSLTRNASLACNAGYTNRTASDEAVATGQSYPYDRYRIGCSGQLLLQ